MRQAHKFPGSIRFEIGSGHWHFRGIATLRPPVFSRTSANQIANGRGGAILSFIHGAQNMKTSIREQMKRHRATIHNPMAAELLATNFTDNMTFPPDAVIASYYPINSEIDVLPLTRQLIAKKFTVTLPVIAGDILEFRQWDGENLIKGKFGINIPPDSSPALHPTHIIVPVLAFDKQRHRIGYGGGYYDRTLHMLGSIRIGVAYDEQKIPLIPADEHDIRLDFIVTEKNLY